ncbi:MAG: FG-GAP-like repeat-containing protein, partial [Verrucomicrobiota bacterium]
MANANQGNRVWLNNGLGTFTDSGMSLGNQQSSATDVADLDGDGDQDAIVANNFNADSIWLNDCLIDLGDFVWEDSNGDGLQTGGEPGIANVMVELYDGTGSILLNSTLTDGAGNYLFSNLPNNTNYELRVTLPVGYTFTLNDQGGDDTIDSDFTAAGVVVAVNGSDLTLDAGLLPPFQIDFSDPPNGTNDVSVGALITVTFDEPVDFATVSTNTFLVYGDQHGFYPGLMSSLNATQVQFAPNMAFDHGERITVELLNGIQNMGNTENLLPHQFQFTVETIACGPSMAFFDSGQSLGAGDHRGITLGDIDGDADLDAFVTDRNGGGNMLWLNDGVGGFAMVPPVLGVMNSESADFGDVDADGDLDLVVANRFAPNTVWTNNGAGLFLDSGQMIGGGTWSTAVKLGDLDGDGDLDAFIVESQQGDRVFFNNGGGVYVDSGQSLGQLFANGRDVDLGDIDGDGDLDAVVANTFAISNMVWVNNGIGVFTLGQRHNNESSTGIELGD